ncbi:MAG: beta-ketoacyl synthase N-terminal-like domain-containing protein, partial [Pseudolabrys sp.]
MASLKDSKGRPVVVVTGMGLVTSLAAGKTDNWARLTAGESGIHAITRFPTEGLRTKIAGTIDYLPPQTSAAALSESFAMLAAEEAIAESAIGSRGDFPGPLFLAVPPIEMDWTQ